MFPIRDNIRARRFPFVTIGLMAVTTAVFFHELTLPSPRLARFLFFYGCVPRDFMVGFFRDNHFLALKSVIGLVSSMFLHGGWLHLVSNMWALWLFGDNVEDRLGHLRYAAFYVVCGIAAMLTHTLLSPMSPIPAIGASGAVAGVMGAYLLLYPFARMLVLVPVLFYPLFVEVPAVLFLLLWIASQFSGAATQVFFGSSGAGGIAFTAHIGGFFAGIFLCRRRRQPTRE